VDPASAWADKKYPSSRNATLRQNEARNVAIFATFGACPAALLLEGLSMTRMIAFSVPLLTFGLLFAPLAQAEDTMMSKDSMHMSKSAHHMKKGAMMHKDSMKKDTMMKDDTQK
jgi:pentapeptide MXKDX repeat protein